MKVAKPSFFGNTTIDVALYRTLSTIPTSSPERFELKITVTPKNEDAYNIAIGFTEDELRQLVKDAATGLNYFKYIAGMRESPVKKKAAPKIWAEGFDTAINMIEEVLKGEVTLPKDEPL